MHKSDKIHAHTIMMNSVQALYCNWDCHWDCLRILGHIHNRYHYSQIDGSNGVGGVETRVQILVYGRIASRISIFLLHLACGVDGCVGSATTNINTEWRLLLILQTMATAIVSIHYESELIFRPWNFPLIWLIVSLLACISFALSLKLCFMIFSIVWF